MASRQGAMAPNQHLNGDFFLCDLFDAAPKSDLASMEHPLFSLATRPDRRILNYVHNDVDITVTPSVRGLATIHDKDILIFCISKWLYIKIQLCLRYLLFYSHFQNHN